MNPQLPPAVLSFSAAWVRVPRTRLIGLLAPATISGHLVPVPFSCINPSVFLLESNPPLFCTTYYWVKGRGR